MKNAAIIFFVFSVLVSGCEIPPVEPQKTQLQIRQFQTRNYETNDIKMIMKAMLNVFQDEGYIIRNADSNLGLITATKEYDVTDRIAEWSYNFGGLGSGKIPYQKIAVIEASANISEFGNKTRVRVNFQKKIFNNLGGIMEVQQIEDAKFYQDFFSKVDKGVFIQKENL